MISLMIFERYDSKLQNATMLCFIVHSSGVHQQWVRRLIKDLTGLVVAKPMPNDFESLSLSLWINDLV